MLIFGGVRVFCRCSGELGGSDLELPPTPRVLQKVPTVGEIIQFHKHVCFKRAAQRPT